MKRLCFILISCVFLFFSSIGQEVEDIVQPDEAGEYEDQYLQDMDQYARRPLNINIVDKNEIEQLRLLNEWQINNFISYRKLLGKFIDIHELQSIPGWDMETIRKILRYLTINENSFSKDELRKQFKKGEFTLITRISRVLENASGFDGETVDSKYSGDPYKLFVRYRYSYKNLIQYGLTCDKDAGEELRKGFDFYSAHLFARKIGVIESLAVGDYTVNMGQGLIQWQSMAFKMSAEVMNVKRQSSILRPYSSAGEFNFNRGVGVTIRKNKLDITAFVSSRHTSSSLAGEGIAFTSFQASGFHRTKSEIENKNNLRWNQLGGNISFNDKNFHIGLNGVAHQFSLPVRKKEEPYNLYAISGDNWYNTSIDYSCTMKNCHVFGETAIDKKSHIASLNGLMISVDPKVDISIVHRLIPKEYQSVIGNAFTENTAPSNENGIYAGISIKPSVAWRLNAYADIYRYPWVKYTIDEPINGKSYLCQLSYTPSRKVEISFRYRRQIEQALKQSCRVQLAYSLNSAITIRQRFENVWYDDMNGKPETGFLSYFDCLYKPLLKPISIITRLQYFETEGYDSRIYAYENDVLYSYAVPVFSGRGYRYGLLLNYDVVKWISCWLRYTQTIYSDQKTISSGLNEINGNKKTEIKLQWMIKI